MDFPRRLFPIQSIGRAIPLATIIAVVAFAACAVTRGGIWDGVFGFVVGMVCGLGAMRFTLPMTLHIQGLNYRAIVGEIVGLIETPTFGFKYYSVQTDVWIPNGPDIYTWDPAIRISRTDNEVVIQGPGIVIRSITMHVEYR